MYLLPCPDRAYDETPQIAEVFNADFENPEWVFLRGILRELSGLMSDP